MNDIIIIPAGVIMPKPLLMWLRKGRDDARTIADEYDMQEDYEDAQFWHGREEAFREVIQHISFGGL